MTILSTNSGQQHPSPQKSHSRWTRSLRGNFSLAVLLFMHLTTDSFGGEVNVGECKMTYRQRATFSVDHPGLIAKVPVEGDQIEAGEIVIQLRDQLPQANLEVARTKAASSLQIQFEQKVVDSSRLEYDAALEANRNATGSVLAYPLVHINRLKLNIEAAELKVKLAEHEKRVNEANVKQAQAELETYRVVSNIGGIVVQVFKHVGEAVQQGEAVVELVNVDSLRVEGYVSLQDSTKLKPGQPVTFQVDLTGEKGEKLSIERHGKLGYISPTVQTLSSRVRVWADLENNDASLREGLPVKMTVHIPDPS